MKKGLLAVAVIALLSQSQIGVSYAVVDIFLYIPGIKGESRTQGRTDWSSVQSSSWGQGPPAPGTASGLKVLFDSVIFTKFIDSTSPTFALFAASGQPFPQAVVEFVRAGEQPIVFARLELFDVRVAQYKAAGGTGGLATESVALSFARIRWTMWKIGPTGQAINPPAVAGWDLMNNKAY
jgi:type VI protein secretion system component Hcp